MVSDPFRNAREESSRVSDKQGIDIGIVVGVDDSGHRVAFREVTETGGIESDTTTSPSVASVAVDSKGDYNLPSEGDLVAILRLMNRNPLVISTFYSQQSDVPDADGAERHVSGEDGVFLVGPFAVAPKRTDDPSDAPDGTLWHREDLDEYRGVEDGTIVRFDTTPV